MRTFMMMIFFTVSITTGWAQNAPTLKQQMDYLHRTKQINFVYDATIGVERAYKGQSIKNMSLHKSLETIFYGTEIEWTIKGNYVLLKKKTTPTTKKIQKRRYTLSGYIRETNGESLINATIFDASTGAGTMSNEYGFFSLTLPEGSHHLRISYIGYDDATQQVELNEDKTMNIHLHQNAKIAEVVVNGDLNSPILTTQTGKRSLSPSDFNKEYSLLSSPDVIKTIQTLSGVNEGVELASGMYVHGGGNDENLFLLDGTPLYQTNHTLGLFSSFNTDIIKNVDFYKSGFPARYGGRLSSVVDVRTDDGDWNHIHGSYSIGLLDGRLHIEGPITPGKTSFNFGLRRSWIDILTRPAFAISNKKDKDEKLKLNYVFWDMNGKVSHRFSERSVLSLSLYSGIDGFKTFDKLFENWNDGNSSDVDVTKDHFKWGNFNAAVNWNYVFSHKLFANFTAIYSHNRSSLDYLWDYRENSGSSKNDYITHQQRGYRSTIYDAGYRSEFDFRPNPHHHIRFGSDYTFHVFHPQTHNQIDYTGSTSNGTGVDTVRINSKNNLNAQEITLFAEDEMSLNERWSANIGMHLATFLVSGKTFCNIDPRLSLKYQVSHSTSLKLSYTMMSQFVHRIANAVIELPTDYWVPTTSRLKPMRSYQIAAGVYSQIDSHWFVSLEAYYKMSHHLLQYSNWMGLEPPAASWDKNVMDGKGLFYGTELDINYHNKKLKASAAYTLSWNKRRYDEFYKDWYYYNFDNRHKINISAEYEFNPSFKVFALWTYHTGNRMTLPTQYAVMPNVPTGNYNSSIYQTYYQESEINDKNFVYETPNNVILPAYHRLDIGCNFYHTTKHGHQRIWNISIYNAYCHLNAIYADVKLRDNGTFRVRSKGFIPIIPSFSYTIKF